MKKLSQYLVIAGTLWVLFGCSEERPVQPSFGKSSDNKYSGIGSSDSKPEPPKDAFDSDGEGATENSIFEVRSTTQDGVDFTFGSVSIALLSEIPSGSAVDRMLYVSDLQTLSEQDKTALLPLCKDINLEIGAETIVSWRSHYSLALKRLIADLMEKGQRQIFCVIRVGEARGYRYLAFDPAPLQAPVVQGTLQADKAVDQNLMMPVAINVAINQNNLVLVNSEGSIVTGVKALGSDGVKLALNDDAGSPCWYDVTKPGSILGNPGNVKKNLLSYSTTIPVSIVGYLSKSTGGRLLKNCSKVKLASTSDSILEEFTCQNYQDIKIEGLEAGCQWEIEFGNVNDAENTIALPLQLNKIPFKTIDLKKADDALSLVPKNPLNPVRTKSASFQNFSESQLHYAELAFDIWLAVYPTSFIEDFKDYMNLVTVSDSCDPGVGGFARLNSTAFTWCAPNLVVAANNPSRPVFHTILIAHETRHSRGWNHDIDNLSYAPCAASAASAAVMHAIVVSCTDDYCATLRNAAINEYITELNYSLRADPRRFQGQCKTWSNEMGLSDQVITGAN